MNLCWIKWFSLITTILALIMGVYGIGFVLMTLINHYS